MIFKGNLSKRILVSICIFLLFASAVAGVSAYFIAKKSANQPALAASAELIENGKINPTVAKSLYNNHAKGVTFNLCGQEYKVAYVNGDLVTAWATGYVHEMAFGTNNIYKGSSVENYLVNTFYPITMCGYSGNIANILDKLIVPASQASGNGAFDSARIWLPSYDEVGNYGVWGLTVDEDRKTALGNESKPAWLRQTYDNVRVVPAWGYVSATYSKCTNICGVRPAFNLSLSALGSYIDLIIDGQINKEAAKSLYTSHAKGTTFMLCGQEYKVTYVNGDTITAWATGYVHEMAFNDDSPYDVYKGSDVEAYLVGTYYTSMCNYGGIGSNTSILNSIIVPASATGNGAFDSARVWLPSYEEVNNGGIWGFSVDTDRAVVSDVSGSAWLRSYGNSDYVLTVAAAGELSDSLYASPRGVRPALNLSISALGADFDLISGGQINKELAQSLYDNHAKGTTFMLCGQEYKVTYVNGDTITAWATGYVHEMAFNDGSPYEYYKYSDIEDYLINTFYPSMCNYNGTGASTSILERIIVLASDTANYSAFDSARLWLPSYDEVNNGGTWGFTGDEDRKTALGTESTSAYLRSYDPDYNLAGATHGVRCVAATGELSSGNFRNILGVRPAFNFSVSALGSFLSVTINLDKAGGTGGSDTVTASPGAAMPAATMPTRTGYIFGGYFTAANGGGTQYYTDAGASARVWDIANSATLYAKWTADTYTVTVNANGGTIPATSGWTGSGASATKGVNYGSAYGTLPIPTRAGYIFQNWSTSLVPDGYTKLEFIQTSGTQYIDTGFIPNQDTSIDMECAISSTNNDFAYYYGAAGANYQDNAFECYDWSLKFQFNYGAQYGFIGQPVADTRIRLQQNKNSSIAIVNGNTYSNEFSATTFTSPVTLALLGLHRNSRYFASQGSMKLYSCKILSGDTLARDFIPVNANGAIGMYDLVEQKFYGNSGTGEFVAGPEIQKIIVDSSTIMDIASDHTLYALWKVNNYKVCYSHSGYKNLVGDLAGGFENAGWAGTFDTKHVRSGGYALKITGNAGSSEAMVPTSAAIPIDASTKTHTFYVQYWGYQEKQIGSTDLYWPIEEPRFGNANFGAPNRWNMYSFYGTRAGNGLAGGKQLRIDFNNNGVAGEVWFDDLIFLDLTATFGAGNEPTKAWCDANITTGVTTQTFTYGQAANLTKMPTTLSGHTFAGWSKTPRTATAQPIDYTDGQSVSNLATGGMVVLYAVWQKKPLGHISANSGGVVRMENRATGAVCEAESNAGYYIIGWYINGKIYQESGKNFVGNRLVLSVADSQSANVYVCFGTSASASPTYAYSEIRSTAVNASIGGEALLVAGDLNSMVNDDTLNFAANIVVSGYEFLGWFANDRLLTTDMSCRLNRATIQGFILEARFAPIDDSNINWDLNN